MSFTGITPSGQDTGSPLNLARRLQLIERHLPLAGAKVLDGGCGTGQFLLALLERGADAHGVEYFAGKVAEFEAAYPHHAGRIRHGDLERLDFPDGTFDGVLLNEVMEHVADEDAALREARRVLVPGGTLVVFSPNRLYPFETHGAVLKHSGREISPWMPFVPYLPVPLGETFIDYRARNYWPWELRSLIARNGFDLVHAGFVWQTFENISGQQPRVVAAVAPVLRFVARWLARVPLLRAFGTSQLIVGRKPG